MQYKGYLFGEFLACSGGMGESGSGILISIDLVFVSYQVDFEMKRKEMKNLFLESES